MAIVPVVDTTRVAWGFLVGLPSVILGLLLLVYPGAALFLLVTLVALWIAMAFLLLILKTKQLQAENRVLQAQVKRLQELGQSDWSVVTGEVPVYTETEAKLTSAAFGPSEPGWKFLEEIDLLLDGSWQPTKTFTFESGSLVKTTVTGNKRFIVHLATMLPKRKFRSIEASGETMKVTRIWKIKSAGDYAFVIEPVGNAPFHVLVRVEEGVKWEGVSPP